MIITARNSASSFRLASTSNRHFESDYYVRLKKSLIVSLILVMVLFYLYPRQQFKTFTPEEYMSAIQVIDIPMMQNEIIPPPSIETTQPQIVEINNDKIEKDRNLKEEIQNESLELSLENDLKDDFIASSQLGDFSRVNYKRSGQGSAFNERLRMDYENRNTALKGKENLSIDLPKSEAKRPSKKESSGLDAKSLIPEASAQEKRVVPNTPPVQMNDINDIFEISVNQFLLKESESTIGTVEYQIWNRINSSLDRLNKDRYGDLPMNVRRLSNGLTVSFRYGDGSQHDIYWIKGGKVIIRVTNNRPENQLAELKKAYDGLLKLIYEATS